MILEIVLLLLGLGGLWLGSELVIKGSLQIAEKFKISPMFIGLTILAIGTDLPELVVNITASINNLQGIDSSGLIVGDIMGSAMTQLALTMGLAGLFSTLFLTKRQIRRDGLMLIVSVLLLFLLSVGGLLTRTEGIILILMYVFYFYTLQREEKVVDKMQRASNIHFGWGMVSLAGGLVLLIFSSNAVVDNALFLAGALGVAQSLIGVLIVGVGTSIPELAVAFNSIRKGASQLGVGNLIGSNIVDVLLVMGVSATIAPIAVGPSLILFDMPFLLLTSFITIVFFWRDSRLRKREAFVMVGLYLLYVILKLFGY